MRSGGDGGGGGVLMRGASMTGSRFYIYCKLGQFFSSSVYFCSSGGRKVRVQCLSLVLEAGLILSGSSAGWILGVV